MVAANEIYRILITRGHCFSFAFLLLQLVEEGGVSSGDFNDLVILQDVVGRADGEASIYGVLSLGEHVVGVEHTTCGQYLKRELCASIHGQVQFNSSSENDYYFIIRLLLRVVIHVVQNVSLLHDIWCARVG